jgi:subtilisin family serine protease
VVGILFARRGSGAPGICPVFLQKDRAAAGKCRARLRKNLPRRLSKASILGRASSTSVPLSFGPHPKGERELEEALNHAAHRGIITVAAAGNQGMVGSSAFTSHVWVISVAACDIQRRPLSESNLTRSIGRRGLSAPGENITSLGTNGKLQTFGGTSAAAPFVAGAIALLWSEFRGATAAQIKLAVTQAGIRRRGAIAPPLLDAWAAYQVLAAADSGRRVQ